MAKEGEGKVKKPFYKRWWFIVAVVLVVMVAVTGGDDEEIADGDDGNNNSVADAEENTNNNDADNNDEANEEENSANNEEDESNNNSSNNEENNGNNEEEALDEDGEAQDTVSIGEAIQVGDVEYVINSVETTQEVGDEFLSESTNDIFIVVNVSSENVGNDSVTLNSSDLQLLLGENTYDADSTASIYANEDGNGLFLESINPGSSIDANVVFDVNPEIAEDPELLIQLQQGLIFAETGLVRINE
ncbi:DUF4352 domain-containing protein [Alkalicoccus luteus]|uniref:DUF4352 domain-containing protein n=1 Tax=Alkalicoccus luteus TaxID=1237094 RepID=A0A969PRU9_9BACI|nr:DUF4352 domain-containing protein [Alkalicoccus luteus]NJP37889.1 DUF4352 domain-containing protein [Alkalicoccus luteus]